MDEEGEGITVPESSVVLTNEFRHLRIAVDPLSDDEEHDCNLFREFV